MAKFKYFSSVEVRRGKDIVHHLLAGHRTSVAVFTMHGDLYAVESNNKHILTPGPFTLIDQGVENVVVFDTVFHMEQNQLVCNGMSIDENDMFMMGLLVDVEEVVPYVN